MKNNYTFTFGRVSSAGKVKIYENTAKRQKKHLSSADFVMIVGAVAILCYFSVSLWGTPSVEGAVPVSTLSEYGTGDGLWEYIRACLEEFFSSWGQV